jgi:hypothetical protein
MSINSSNSQALRGSENKAVDTVDKPKLPKDVLAIAEIEKVSARVRVQLECCDGQVFVACAADVLRAHSAHFTQLLSTWDGEAPVRVTAWDCTVEDAVNLLKALHGTHLYSRPTMWTRGWPSLCAKWQLADLIRFYQTEAEKALFATPESLSYQSLTHGTPLIRELSEGYEIVDHCSMLSLLVYSIFIQKVGKDLEVSTARGVMKWNTYSCMKLSDTPVGDVEKWWCLAHAATTFECYIPDKRTQLEVQEVIVDNCFKFGKLLYRKSWAEATLSPSSFATLCEKLLT